MVLRKSSFQINILKRITTTSDYSKIYLFDYEQTTEIKKSGKDKDLFGTVTVLGTFNNKKNLREQYKIKIFKYCLDDGSDNIKCKMFSCSCVDFKINCKCRDNVCKHICFLVCKVANILKPYFFEYNKLTTSDFEL